jgi:hypothetical protein
MTGLHPVLDIAANLAVLAAALAFAASGVIAVKRASAGLRRAVTTVRRQHADIPHDRLTGRRFIENLIASRIVEHGPDATVVPALNLDLYGAAWEVYNAHRLPNPWVAQGIQVGLFALTDALLEIALSNPYPDPAPTLADLLDKVRATSLDDPLNDQLTLPTLTAGATR